VSRLGILTVAALSCWGCGALRPQSLLKPHLTVAVDIGPDANDNKPIAFDLVQINDKDLAKDVAKMTAADWFQKRDQIRGDFPKANSISVLSWEWVPGQVVPQIQIPMRRAPRAILVFANYSNPGAHRMHIDPSMPVGLSLGKADIALEPLAK
jgi:type VI secretion system protein